MSLVHAYFTPINLDVAKQIFFKSEFDEPQFIYRDVPSQKPPTMSQECFNIIKAGQKMRLDPTEKHIQLFNNLNKTMYGEIKKDYCDVILRNICRNVTTQSAKEWEYIDTLLNAEKNIATIHDDIVVSNKIFQKYRKMYLCYFNDYIQELSEDTLSISESFKRILQYMHDDNWRLIIKNDDSHARVNQYKKCIIIGQYYIPRNHKSTMRIVAHEIFGHVLRGKPASLGESEGMAILFEQLLDTRFKYRRSMRYIVAGIALGLYGNRPLSFRETYEICWRILKVHSKYNEMSARSYAFNECVRIFRGGLTGAHGALYLKDTLYFTANFAIWNQLTKREFSYNEFIDIIKGRKTLIA